MLELQLLYMLAKRTQASPKQALCKQRDMMGTQGQYAHLALSQQLEEKQHRPLALRSLEPLKHQALQIIDVHTLWHSVQHYDNFYSREGHRKMFLMPQAMETRTTPSCSEYLGKPILALSEGWVLTSSPQREAPSSLVKLVSRAVLVNVAPFEWRQPECAFQVLLSFPNSPSTHKRGGRPDRSPAR